MQQNGKQIVSKYFLTEMIYSRAYDLSADFSSFVVFILFNKLNLTYESLKWDYPYNT